MEKSSVNEVVSTLDAVKSNGQPGFWILLSILIVLVLVIAAVMYQRIVINRFQTASKAVVISGLSRIYGGLLASALAAAHRWVGQKNNPRTRSESIAACPRRHVDEEKDP